MRNIGLFLCGILLICSGCIAWFGGTDPVTGEEHKGYIPALQEGVEAVEFPFSGVVAGALGIITVVGQFFTGRSKQKKNFAAIVAAFEKLKPELAKINTDEDLEKFINEKLPKDSPVGKLLYKAWVESKKL